MDDTEKQIPPEKDKDYWEREKARLEASKLDLEFQHYGERLRLEDEKLKSDLKDWYVRIVMTMLTAVASVLAFFVGRAYENSSDKNKQQFELQLERDRIENEEFNKNVTALSSTDASQRATATAALRWYMQHYQQGSPQPAGVDSQQIQQRIDQILQAISIRMPSEADPILLREYSQLLLLEPNASLPYAVLLNKEAGPQFARTAAEYVAWSVRNPAALSSQGCPDADQQLANSTTRAPMPFEGEVDESGNPLRVRINAPRLLRVPRLQTLYRLECSRILDLSSREKNDQRVSQLLLSSNEIIRATQFLSSTSLTLNRLLHQLSGHVANRDLSGTFMVNGTMDNLNLSSANLSESYMNASGAQHFTCQHCDFTGADLSDFNLMQPYDLDGSIFKQASLPDALKNYASTPR